MAAAACSADAAKRRRLAQDHRPPLRVTVRLLSGKVVAEREAASADAPLEELIAEAAASTGHERELLQLQLGAEVVPRGARLGDLRPEPEQGAALELTLVVNTESEQLKACRQRLASEKAGVRASGLRALHKVPGFTRHEAVRDAVLQLLQRALGDEADEVYLAACKAAKACAKISGGATGSATAVQCFRLMCASLRRIVDCEEANPYEARIYFENVPLLWKALEACALSGGKEAAQEVVGLLLEYAVDVESELARDIARSVVECPALAREAIAPLLQRIAEHAVPRVRRAACEAVIDCIRRAKNVRVALDVLDPLLRCAAEDSVGEVCTTACEAACEIVYDYFGNAQVACRALGPMLQLATGSAHDHVRAVACDAVGACVSIRSPQNASAALSPLLDATEDRCPDVRGNAFVAIASCVSTSAMASQAIGPLLRRVDCNESYDLCHDLQHAVLACVATGGAKVACQAAGPLLRQAVACKDAEVRGLSCGNASACIMTGGPAAALPSLGPLLRIASKDKDKRVRQCACAVIRDCLKMGGDEIRTLAQRALAPLVRQAAVDEDPRVRAMACMAAGDCIKVGGAEFARQAVAPLRKLASKDKVEAVRRGASRALKFAESAGKSKKKLSKKPAGALKRPPGVHRKPAGVVRKLAKRPASKS